MQILLLSRGDAKSKTLLRHALAARYGFGAPALDATKITFKGRARVKVGPVHTWIPMDATALFRFPMHARWDFSIRPVGVPMRSESRTFDNTVFCRQQGDSVEVLDSEVALNAMRQQVWASALVLLSPLTEANVEVVAIAERSMLATNMTTKTCVTVHLNDDYTLNRIETPSIDLAKGHEQLFTVQCSEGFAHVNDLMMPRKITLLWDNEPEYEVTPVSVEVNPALGTGLFRHQALT